jgi:hypothetical protein
MSTVKNPGETKRFPLTRDCRNIDRENPAANRKGIAKGKQRQHQNERRSAAQVLGPLDRRVDEGFAPNVQLQAKVATAVSRKNGFKKMADRRLGRFLEFKNTRRQVVAVRKAGAPKNH